MQDISSNEEGGLQNQMKGKSYNFEVVWSGTPDGIFENLFLITDANDFG